MRRTTRLVGLTCLALSVDVCHSDRGRSVAAAKTGDRLCLASRRQLVVCSRIGPASKPVVGGRATYLTAQSVLDHQGEGDRATEGTPTYQNGTRWVLPSKPGQDARGDSDDECEHHA
jgi:hypothetical protein